MPSDTLTRPPKDVQNTSFIAPVNPLFDLNEVKKHAEKPQKPPTLLPFEVRDALIIQPPLAFSEKLPLFLALKPGELAISSANKPDFVFVSELKVYIPVRHQLVLDQIRREIADSTAAHGSPAVSKTSCQGPLCRRQRRFERSEATRLRTQRISKTPTNDSNASQRKTSAPQYAAVEPLIIFFTVLQFKKFVTQTQLTSQQKAYRSLRSLRDVMYHLSLAYPTQVL